MRKTGLTLMFMAIAGVAAQAQIGRGGLPESVQHRDLKQYVPVTALALPDWDAYKKKEIADLDAGISKPLTVALLAPMDIRFPASGSIVTLEDGKRIWRSQVKIDGAPAIGFYYDRFHLPAGVKYFISNGNGAQILGAYTPEHNAADGLFATEAVQGSTVNIELDIEADVNLDDIDFHINRSSVYFRSYEYLNQYAGANTIATEVDSALDGSASVCMINAICPLGNKYPVQRKASVQTLYVLPGDKVGVCSATMINNTGNTATSCKQYVLTATHCEGNNDTVSSAFNQVLVRFNFERAQCTGGIIPEAKTMVGVNYVARSNYTGAANLKGDFLLLELRQAIPAAWDVTLNGWNRDPNHATSVAAPKKFIGFHHPSGDTKKVTSSQTITDNAGRIWSTVIDTGYGARGSSGSGLFDGDGYLIGIASTAGLRFDFPCGKNVKGDSTDYFKNVNYSRLDYDWDYAVDGNNPRRKLKPWLDPANTGVITLKPVKSNCAALDGSGTAIRSVSDELGAAISVYPNPNTTGKVTATVNLPEAADLKADIYDITGKKQQTLQFNHVKSGSFSFDLSSYANGMYIINFSNGTATAAKKIMLTR